MCYFQVKLTNPSTKALNYAVAIIGDDAENFSLPKGNNISIQPKHATQLTIVFQNVFLRSNYATLILTGRRLGSGLGANIAFSLVTKTSDIIPQVRYFSIQKLSSFFLNRVALHIFPVI